MTVSRVGLLMILSLGSCLAAAQSQSIPTVPEVQALLEASGATDVTAEVGPIAAQQLTIALHHANPNLSSRADAIVVDVVVSYLRREAEHDHVADRLVPIYAKYLAKDDVQRLTRFYRSPVGRKLVSVTAAVSLESAKVGQEWMESILPGLQAELLARLKSEKLIQ